MMIDVFEHLHPILEDFDDEEQIALKELFESIQFKLNRNSYHMNNIKRVISESKNVDSDDYYHKVHYPIYYEMESLLVSLRSSVDVLLHLLNFCFDFRLTSNEITLTNIYHHDRLPKNVKNIFDRYTRPYKNPTWRFIYTFRNETVHERSINQVLPIRIDLFTSEEPIVIFKLDEQDKEILAFFNQCQRFLDNFSTQLFNAIKISL